MKKKLTILTILILIVALTLGACVVTPPEEPHEHTYESGWTTSPTHHWHAATCEHTTDVRGMAPHSYSNNKCTVCGYEKEIKQDPTPIPTPDPETAKKAEEMIAEYLVSLGDNFSVSATITIPMEEQKKYSMCVDGNNIYASNAGELYYVEQIEEGSYYVYTQDDEGAWHKKHRTNDTEVPTNTAGTLVLLLSTVDWQEYDEEKGVVKGYYSIEDIKFDIPNLELLTKYGFTHFCIEFTVTEYGAAIQLSAGRFIWDEFVHFIDLGNAKIYDVGSTTVTLPQDYIDDTAL